MGNNLSKMAHLPSLFGSLSYDKNEAKDVFAWMQTGMKMIRVTYCPECYLELVLPGETGTETSNEAPNEESEHNEAKCMNCGRGIDSNLLEDEKDEILLNWLQMAMNMIRRNSALTEIEPIQFQNIISPANSFQHGQGCFGRIGGFTGMSWGSYGGNHLGGFKKKVFEPYLEEKMKNPHDKHDLELSKKHHDLAEEEAQTHTGKVSMIVKNIRKTFGNIRQLVSGHRCFNQGTDPNHESQNLKSQPAVPDYKMPAYRMPVQLEEIQDVRIWGPGHPPYQFETFNEFYQDMILKINRTIQLEPAEYSVIKLGCLFKNHDIQRVVNRSNWWDTEVYSACKAAETSFEELGQEQYFNTIHEMIRYSLSQTELDAKKRVQQVGFILHHSGAYQHIP